MTTNSTPAFLTHADLSSLQQLDGVYVPYGYEVWSDGIYRRSGKMDTPNQNTTPSIPPNLMQPLPGQGSSRLRRVTYRPVWISAYGEVIDMQEPLVQLTYYRVDGVRASLWVSRYQIASEPELVRLAANGVPVDAKIAPALMEYLAAQESINGPLMQPTRVIHRSGFYRLADGKVGWLLGTRWYGPDIGVSADPRGASRYAAAFRTAGDYAVWHAFNSQWIHGNTPIHASYRFHLAAVYAAVMLQALGERTFIIHHYGNTGHGKTAMAAVINSAMGDPQQLLSSLNRTSVSITEPFAEVANFLVLYDELQNSTVEPAELVYSICGGVGRERAKREGGLRKQTTWCTIARVTGEQPLVSKADLGGQLNRTLQLHTPCFPTPEAAAEAYNICTKNYGFSMPAFLTHLVKWINEGGGLPELRSFFHDFTAVLKSRLGQSHNHVRYCAAIAVGNMLQLHWFYGYSLEDAKRIALDDSAQALFEAAPTRQQDYSERVLGFLRDHWMANMSKHYIDDTTVEGRMSMTKLQDVVGIEVHEGMAYLPAQIDAVLVKAGFVPERFWLDARGKGWIQTDKADGLLTTLNRFRGKSQNHEVYLVRRDVITGSTAQSTPMLSLLEGGLSLLPGA